MNEAELIDSYLNGPRTLSNSRLSYLVLSRASPYPGRSIPTPPHTPSPTDEPGAQVALATENQSEEGHNYELLICAMHFLGDGMALHTFANDFLGLLGSEKTELELEAQLSEEWKGRWGDNLNDVRPKVDDHFTSHLSPFGMCWVLSRRPSCLTRWRITFHCRGQGFDVQLQLLISN